MKHLWLITLFASVATPAVAQQYQYVARTEAPATRQGAVTAGPLTWQCQGSACTISGPWPAPGVSACAALAREVGRITAYGRQGNMLGAPALATCNDGIAAAAPTLRLPPAATRVGPLVVVRPQPTPTPNSTPAPTPAPSASNAITTPEFSFIVGGPVAPAAPAAPVTTRIDVTQFSFVVGGPVAPAAPAAPPVTTTIAVPEFSFIVR